jgi:hypothetical protein
MHLPSRLAIAVCLGLAAMQAAGQQDAGSTPNGAAQAPAPAAAEGQTPPVEKGSASDQKSRDSQGDSNSSAAGRPSAGTSPVAKNGKRHKRSAPPPDGGPRKVVVREGGASEPAAQIAPGMTPAEAARERQNAEQLLGSTGVQLTGLAARTLDAPQQETVAQIRNYMDGARLALKDGDVRRANTLATKAHLLAEDLVKH